MEGVAYFVKKSDVVVVLAIWFNGENGVKVAKYSHTLMIVKNYHKQL
jgi:hypothetical protein